MKNFRGADKPQGARLPATLSSQPGGSGTCTSTNYHMQGYRNVVFATRRISTCTLTIICKATGNVVFATGRISTCTLTTICKATGNVIFATRRIGTCTATTIYKATGNDAFTTRHIATGNVAFATKLFLHGYPLLPDRRPWG